MTDYFYCFQKYEIIYHDNNLIVFVYCRSQLKGVCTMCIQENHIFIHINHNQMKNILRQQVTNQILPIFKIAGKANVTM